MTFKKTYTTGFEQDFNSREYVRCLQEGINDWVEVKEATGNSEIKKLKTELNKEIKSNNKKGSSNPFVFINSIIKKMKVFGVNKETLNEFKLTFLP